MATLAAPTALPLPSAGGRVVSGPANPFAGESDLDLGARLLEGVRDALLADGLFGLYRAVATLDRNDRVRAALASAVEIVTAEVVGEVAGDAGARSPRRADTDRLSEGELLLVVAIRAVAEDGLEAARAAVENCSDRELGAILRDGHERIWTRILAERAERRRRS